jgi:hypothetical protein
MEDIANDTDTRVIDEVLTRFPHLQSIITKNPDFYRLTRAQFGESTPSHQQELRLSGILRNIDSDKSFINLIRNLEHWLSLNLEYRTKKFGRKLSDNFFSHYSEIEVYHHLKQVGLEPIRDPTIEINGVTKELDFRIRIDERDFFIEVITPRPSQEWEDAFDKGFCGFADPAKGLGPKNLGDYSRIETVVLKEIKKHFPRILSDTPVDFSIIIALNCHWTAGEILPCLSPSIFEKLPSFISVILIFDEFGHKVFYPNPQYLPSQTSLELFDRLMEH